MYRPFMLITLLITAAASPAMAQFNGDVAFTPTTDCLSPNERRLARDLEYVDRNGMGWVAAAGNCTDGASIPSLVRPIIGHPFDADIVRAAVIHDHYCDRHVRSWPETHWVFYDALRASGVSRRRALTMYFAVMAAGPKWIKLIPPMRCGVGEACIMQTAATVLPSGVSSVVTIEGETYARREARYQDPQFPAALDAFHDSIAHLDDSEALTEEEEALLLAEARAEARAYLGEGDPFVRYAISGLLYAPGLSPAATE